MIFKAIVLGIVEGITEFLPISSTGHLIIVNHFIKFTGSFANVFDVVIQVGAIFAVIIYFKDKLFPKLNNRKQSHNVYRLWAKVVVGFIPAAALGFLFKDYIDAHFFAPKPVAWALIVGAVLLLLVEARLKKVRVSSTEKISYMDAFLIGIMQCLALWPGMSRSASTIIGGLLIGLSREVSAEFSFFLAIPTLIGAAVLMLLKGGIAFTGYQWLIILIGTLVSFIAAYLVVALFMNYIKKKKLAPFAYYRIAVGLIILLFIK